MAKRANVEIVGQFHGKKIVLRPELFCSDDSMLPRVYFSPGQVRKARKVLCGIKGCQCADGVLHTAAYPVRVIDGAIVALL